MFTRRVASRILLTFMVLLSASVAVDSDRLSAQDHCVGCADQYYGEYFIGQYCEDIYQGEGYNRCYDTEDLDCTTGPSAECCAGDFCGEQYIAISDELSLYRKGVGVATLTVSGPRWVAATNCNAQTAGSSFVALLGDFARRAPLERAETMDATTAWKGIGPFAQVLKHSSVQKAI